MSLTAFEGSLDGRGCGRVGPFIARAVHRPGQWGSGRRGARRFLSNEVLGSLLPERLQQTLHDRMLSRPELFGVSLAQPANDGERVNCGSAASQSPIVAMCGSSLDGMRTLVL